MISKINRKGKKRKAQIFLYVLVMVAVMGALGASLSNVWQSELAQGPIAKDGLQAFYIAQAGLERAKAELAADWNWAALPDCSTGTFSVNYQNGTYSLCKDDTAARKVYSIGELGNAKRVLETTLAQGGGEEYTPGVCLESEEDCIYSECNPGQCLHPCILECISGIVLKEDFKALYPQQNIRTELFNDLRNTGYIDTKGRIQQAFEDLNGYSELVLDAAFMDEQEEIYNILKETGSQAETEFSNCIYDNCWDEGNQGWHWGCINTCVENVPDDCTLVCHEDCCEVITCTEVCINYQPPVTLPGTSGWKETQ